MNLFDEGKLCEFLEQQTTWLKTEIASLDPNYLLNANETQLIQHFIEKYQIDPLEVHADNKTISHREESISAERLAGFGFSIEQGANRRKLVVIYHIPFSGDQRLLWLAPSDSIPWTQGVNVSYGEILFEIIAWSNDSASISREVELFLSNVQVQAGYVATEINDFNNRLKVEVEQEIKSRKADLLRKLNLLASLDVPLRKADDVPSTFAVPVLKKRVTAAKPPAPISPFVPEPSLDEVIYQDILKIINHTGTEIERHPSIYQGKDEETLRDHFLMVLSPHFSSVTGETFNKSGKTDILIRHEGKNLFVAECGIWKGAKQFLEKIDQLLSYLTWRDSKTALICFVRNKGIGAVIETIKKEFPSHTSFVKEHSPIGEAWLRYEFTLKDDPTRSVRVAVLCFHYA